MARHHDETDPTQHVYEVAYRAYQDGGYVEAVDAVRPIIAAEVLTALADDLERFGMEGVHISHVRARAEYARMGFSTATGDHDE